MQAPPPKRAATTKKVTMPQEELEQCNHGATVDDSGRRSDDVAAEDGTAERACLSEVCSTWQHTHNKHIRNT